MTEPNEVSPLDDAYRRVRPWFCSSQVRNTVRDPRGNAARKFTSKQSAAVACDFWVDFERWLVISFQNHLVMLAEDGVTSLGPWGGAVQGSKNKQKVKPRMVERVTAAGIVKTVVPS